MMIVTLLSEITVYIRCKLTQKKNNKDNNKHKQKAVYSAGVIILRVK